MKLFRAIKKSIGKFIDNLAKANQKNLGSKPLDCCSLNKNTKN